MAVYNFSYVGLDTVSLHTHQLATAITKAFAPRELIMSKYALFKNKVREKPVGDLPFWVDFHFRLSRYCSEQIKQIEKNVEDLKSKGAINLRIIFGPIYSYCGFYCFSIIYLGGLVESYAPHFQNKLFFFIHIYNLLIFIPIFFFSMRGKRQISPLLFIAILVAHYVATVYLVNTIASPVVLFDFYLFDAELSAFIRSHFILLFIISIIIYIITYICFTPKGRRLSLRIYGKLILFIIFIFASFFYLYLLMRNLEFRNLDNLFIINTTIFISFLPLLLLILRSSLGVLIYIRFKHFLIFWYLSWFFKNTSDDITAPFETRQETSRESGVTSDQDPEN